MTILRFHWILSLPSMSSNIVKYTTWYRFPFFPLFLFFFLSISFAPPRISLTVCCENTRTNKMELPQYWDLESWRYHSVVTWTLGKTTSLTGLLIFELISLFLRQEESFLVWALGRGRILFGRTRRKGKLWIFLYDILFFFTSITRLFGNPEERICQREPC